MLNRLTILLAGAALLAPATAGAQHDLRAARASLHAADSALSAAAEANGLRDALLSSLADSAHVLIPGAALARGSDAAAQVLAFGPTAGARLRWAPVRVDVSADGHSGYTYGGGTRTAADGTAASARYIAFWRWDGRSWKVSAFHYNASPQPMGQPPAGFFPEPASAGAARAEADAAAALEQIMQADRDFAALAAARDPGVAFATWAAPDGALASGEYGPQAIGAAFAGGGATLEWGPVGGGMAASGDLGYTVGTAVMRGAEGRVGYTKYLTIWRRQPDGTWKWVVDGGNPRPADPSPNP
jgi:ketosteroid isomerase-like protein